MTVTVTINDREITVDEGVSIWEAARLAGVEIPALCHHPALTPVGSCRLCMVEVDGWDAPVASCVQPVFDQAVARTETDALKRQRREILELLLLDYDDEGRDPTVTTATAFERWVSQYGAKASKSQAAKAPVDTDPNPAIRVDMNQCILCTRCVRACEEIQGRHVWGVGNRGRETTIIAGADTDMLTARCESCGACEALCPTGALTDRLAFGNGDADELVKTTCGYCGVGCQFDFNIRDDRIVRVTSNSSDPVNGISLCVKGRYGWDFIHHDERLLKPRVRAELLQGETTRRKPEQRGEWVEVDWDIALDRVAEKFNQIRTENGPDALGVLSSAKCSNEENYLAQKFARQVLGTHNVDHCARLCHSSTVAGLAMCFGSGAMSNSMDDVAKHAKAVFVIGSNTTEQHPVFGAMIRQAVQNRGMKLIVADPRAIDLVEFSTLHLRQRPGTDVALLNGLMHLILKNGDHDESFIADRCENFDAFRASIEAVSLNNTAERTGVSISEMEAAAKILGSNKPMAVIWAMGITQHTTGVMNVLNLGNLQMLLGNMGIPGGGVNPLRGQNNVQGACDMGALPNVFPGYQPVTDSAVVEKFKVAWKLSEDDRTIEKPATPGLTVTEMVDSAGCGDLRGLYIIGENPAMTDPDSNHVRECLANAEFVVLQEILPSETSQFADVLLPGVTFAERDGTSTNTERRIQRFQKAISPRGSARADWEILAELAKRVLKRRKAAAAGPHAVWDYTHPSEIMNEIAAVTPSYAGVNYTRLDADERLQWPVLNANHPGTPILHVDKFTRGKGRFHVVEDLPPREMPDDDYPLLLTTGRVLYHWHGGEMTRRSRALNDLCPVPQVEISPADAEKHEIIDGSHITLQSRRGEMSAVAVITDRVSPGVIFGNFHFTGDGNVNNLTIAALDPVAKIPEYKVCAVRLHRGQ